MQALELFAWTRSFWKIAEKFGYKVFSLEIDSKFGCNLTMDILDFDPGAFPEICPDIIWASPDCTSFSFASAWYHRDKFARAKTDKAILWEKLLEKTLFLIDYYLRKNPKLFFYIENPRWYMSRHPIMVEWKKKLKMIEHLITYCSYWWPYRKPTNIWTNDITWNPKKRCWYKTKNAMEMFPEKLCHHEYCSHNWKTWLVWNSNKIERSIIPSLLFHEILSYER